MLLWSVRFNTRSRARVCWRPENMLHHMLPAEPSCLHSTRQSIHSAQPGLARPSSEPPSVMGSNKGLTRRSVQEGTAVEVQRPSGTRAMGYGFIGSYQSASGALPLCDPRPSGASGLFRASFYACHWRGGDEVSSTSKPPLKGGKCVRP